MEAVIGNVFFFDWEVSFMEWFQNSVGAVPAAILTQLSLFGEQMVMIAVMGLFYWCLDKEKGKFIGLNVIMASLWNPMIKNIFLRRRPYMDNSGIKLLRKIDKDADIMDVYAQGYSFPSGHSASAVAVYGSLAASIKKKVFLILAIVLPLLVGISRVFVGAHYPTDVICGWILGLFCLLVISAGYRRIRNPAVFYGILLLVSLPGFFYCESSDFYTSYGLLLGATTGFLFEAKYVNFEGTKKPLLIILRLLGGVAIYFGLNTLLKLPFSSELLDSGTTAAHLIRTGRYAVVIFVDIALYPMLFGRFFKKESVEAAEETEATAE